VLVQPIQTQARRNQAGNDVAQRMHPIVNCLIGEASIGVHVIGPLRVDDGLAREVRGEPSRHTVWRARGVIENVGCGMAFGQVERSTRMQQRRDDLSPSRDIGQPADGAPSDEHHVELVGRRYGGQGITEIGMNKARALSETGLLGQLTRLLDSRSGEIEPDHRRAPLSQCQAIRPEMALQVGDALSFDRWQLCLLDCVQLAVPRPQLGEIVATGTHMDADPLVPVGTIGAVPRRLAHRGIFAFQARFGHPMPREGGRAIPRKKRSAERRKLDAPRPPLPRCFWSGEPERLPVEILRPVDFD
jgi:hypothetical protein